MTDLEIVRYLCSALGTVVVAEGLGVSVGMVSDWRQRQHLEIHNPKHEAGLRELYAEHRRLLLEYGAPYATAKLSGEIAAAEAGSHDEDPNGIDDEGVSSRQLRGDGWLEKLKTALTSRIGWLGRSDA